MGARPRKWMSKFPKWLLLTHEIFGMLPVFSQFLWNLTSISRNACTLVPTVFRWHGKMELKCHLHFSFSHDIEKQIWILLFVFRFRITLKNGHEFHFSFFVFASLWKTDNKVAEHSFGSLWVYVICQIMAREPFIRAYKECLSWVPFYLSLEHIFCATYRRS